MNRVIAKAIKKITTFQQMCNDYLDNNNELSNNQRGMLYIDTNGCSGLLIDVLSDAKKPILFENYAMFLEIVTIKECGLEAEEIGQVFFELLKHNNDVLKTTSESELMMMMVREELNIIEDNNRNTKMSTSEYNIQYKLRFGVELEIHERAQSRLSEKRELYADICDCLSKNIYDDEVLHLLIEKLYKIGTPENLMYALVSYMKNPDEQEETKVMKNDVYKIKPKKIQPKQVPKRVLKQKLSELYHEEENEAYFDFKDSKELFTVVRDLNMPDEKAKEILGGITRCAIKNQAYYDYLVEKVKYLNQTNRYKGRFTSTLSDIEEYRQLYEIVDEEAKEEIKQELLNLYTGLEFIFVESDALDNILKFEMNR